MEDKYLDEKLKGILESPPDYPVPSSAVSDMQRRIRAANMTGKRRITGLMLLPLLLIPFMAGGIFFYQKYDRLNCELVNLKKQFSLLAVEKDTIVEHRTVHHYDTIYTVIYRELYREEIKPTKNQTALAYYPNLYPDPLKQTSQFNTTNMNVGWSLDLTGSSSLDNYPGSSFFNSMNTREKKVLLTPAEELNLLELLAIEKFKMGKLDIEEINSKLKEAPVSFKKKKINPIAYITPKAINVKGNYTQIVRMQNEYGGTGRIFGVSSEIELPKNRSIEIGAEYVDFGLEFNDINILPDIPVANPDNPGDVLNELRAKMYYIQIPLIIRHKLLKNSSIQPSISAGVVGAIPIRQEFNYEYKNSSEEYYKSVSANNGTFSIDNLRFGLGAQYSFWKNISVESELQYQHGISKDETALFPVRYWSLRFGLNYRI